MARGEEQTDTDRLEIFSDGVFAIAITLLVLEIRPPDDMHDLGHKLAGLWPSYVAYSVSFLLIGLIWANHHAMFQRIERADRTLLFLNTLLLLCVAFLPFPTSVLARAFAQGAGERLAVFLYGAVLAVGGVFFNAVWRWAAHERRLVDPENDAHVVALGRWFILGPILYFVAALVGLAVPGIGVAGYAALIVFYWLPPTVGRLTTR